MKRIFIASALLAGLNLAFAQQSADKNQDNDLMTWYHKDIKTANVYGVNTQGAYSFLESKGLKPTPIVVGVLDSGVEVDHPGLIKNMWINTKEIPNNGIDDDKNGYVDDIHGWNFMGSSKGDVDVDNMEVTRVVRQYKPIFESENSAKNKANQAKMPEEFEMYIKSKKIYDEKSVESRRYTAFFTKLKETIPTMIKLLKGKNLSQEVLSKITPTQPDEAIALDFLSRLGQDPELKGATPDKVKDYMDNMVKEALDHYEPSSKQYDLDFDTRAELVGDDYNNYNQKHYGNNHYEGPDALHGTHVAGIIAGYPQGGEVQYGVASKVAKIMTVRAVPDGDERDKDVANAIRYAVDNGAKILNMSFGKPVSPGKKQVWEALKYAESKGVLLVKAAGNENEDIEVYEYFPTNFKKTSDTKPFVSNMIVVGASTNRNDDLKASFSNYNKKMVNVFAPGEQIYSTVPDGKYQYLQGTSMASPVVGGVAALLWSYMPSLSPQQIIESLVKTSNKSKSETGLAAPNNTFENISEAGGVIDVAKAAEYAYTHFYKDSKKGRSKRK